MFGNNMAKVEKLIAKKDGAGLVKLAEDKDAGVRQAAIVGLGKAGGEAAFNALVNFLRSPDPQIRAAAAAAAGELGDPKIRAHIEHQLMSEKDTNAATALHSALGKIKEKI